MLLFVLLHNCVSLAFICLMGDMWNGNRLAGATLIAPVVNYWWPGIPANLSKEAHDQQFPSDRWSNRVAHYIPWLTYWWNTQKWFPSCSVIVHSPAILSRQDLELLPRFASRKEHKVFIMKILSPILSVFWWNVKSSGCQLSKHSLTATLCKFPKG